MRAERRKARIEVLFCGVRPCVLSHQWELSQLRVPPVPGVPPEVLLSNTNRPSPVWLPPKGPTNQLTYHHIRCSAIATAASMLPPPSPSSTFLAYLLLLRLSSPSKPTDFHLPIASCLPSFHHPAPFPSLTLSLSLPHSLVLSKQLFPSFHLPSFLPSLL